mgnify:CR=1 FL=1
MIFESHSPKDTKKFAKGIGQKFLAGQSHHNKARLIALIGDLGSGKTTFTQGFAEGLGIKDKIISPTFILIRQHPIPNSKKTLFHIDLYRLEKDFNLNELGLSEIFDKKGNLVLIEWADKISNLAPKETIRVNIKKISQNTREISIKNFI